MAPICLKHAGISGGVLFLLLLHTTIVSAQWDCKKNLATGLWECGNATAQSQQQPAALPPPPAEQPASPRHTPVLAPAAPETQPTSAAATPPKPTSTTQAATPPSGNQRWEYCESNASATPPAALDKRQRETLPTYVSADQGEMDSQEIRLFGNVEVKKADQDLRAERIVHNRAANTITATDGVNYQEDGLALASDQATMQLDADQGTFSQAQYRLPRQHAHGRAQQIEVEGKHRTTLHNTTYTTCNPGAEHWSLHAKQVTIDEQQGKATGKHVSFWIKKVPLLYTPYVSFPIDNRRKSGFLTPGIGSSNVNGTEVLVPYYWNISANRDATITPHYFSERGLQLQTEYRYLHSFAKGKLHFDYLADDDLALQEDRWHVRYQQSGSLTSRLSSSVAYRQVSDDTYLHDFEENSGKTTASHLEKVGQLAYTTPHWSVTGRAQAFQALNSTKPYQRLPQLLVSANYPNQAFGLSYLLDAEAVRFDKDTGVTGNRFDIKPKISLPLENAAAFITPSVSIRHTRYDLDNFGGATSKFDRSVPTFSLDSGIFLERDHTWFNSNYLHTVEPRLFYVYTPHRDQTNIPIFDTSTTTLSYTQMFQEDRFTNADRVADANQITAAVTTRFFDNESGVERFSASIGEIFYLDEPRVRMAGNSPLTQNRSHIIAKTTVRPWDDILVSGEVQWDYQIDRAAKGNARVQYRGETNQLFGMGYRLIRDSVEEAELSMLWPISQRWQVIGRWNQSLRFNQALETIAGFQYDSCCWTFRAIHRRYIDDNNVDETDERFMVQIEAKGLAGIGREIDDILKESILGYEEIPY